MVNRDLVGALIVDDQADIRLLLKISIEKQNEGLFVQGEAADGAEAVRRVRELQPAVVVMDHMMPTMTGLEAARQILADSPDQRILLCTAYLNSTLEAEATELGIPCLSKDRIGEVPRVLAGMREDRPGP
jgi:CheY-like chemotaxis protein